MLKYECTLSEHLIRMSMKTVDGKSEKSCKSIPVTPRDLSRPHSGP
jgi:hypothetical protein